MKRIKKIEVEWSKPITTRFKKPKDNSITILPSRLHEADEVGHILRILALDPATHCGYALSHSLYGVWDLTAKRDESAGMRLIRLRAKLNEIIQSEQINLIVFERPGGRFKSSIIVQSEIQGQIKTVCEDNKVQYRAYSSTEIKKFATGKGNCGKPAMIAAAKKKLNYSGNNDNEADALWLLELAQRDYK